MRLTVADLMSYRLADGRLLTVDLATAEWRLDGFRVTEAKASALLEPEHTRHGLGLGLCAACGDPRTVALVRPRPEPGLRVDLAPPPASPYCLACLNALTGGGFLAAGGGR